MAGLSKAAGARHVTLSLLPPEMHLEIASWLSTPDLSSLSRTASFFHDILTPTLYRRALAYKVPKTGSSVLYWATCFRRASVIRILLEIGSDTFEEYDVKEALESAAEWGYLDVVENFLTRPSTLSASENGHFAFYLALTGGHMPVARYLCNAGADLRKLYCEELYVLHEVARNADMEALRFVLDIGVEIGEVNNLNQTALHIAAGIGHYQMVQFLLEKGADVSAIDSFGFTTLFHAASVDRRFKAPQPDSLTERAAIIKLLVACGVNMSASDANDLTVLHYV
ncbi:ANKDD1A protein [Coccidioides immitis H538.4]|nr:ANKDD1A protein [Coccidioides immitis H538.4]